MKFCCGCRKYVETLIFDVRLDWFYRKKGVCPKCHLKLLREATLLCTRCRNEFIKDNSWPHELCPCCRIQDKTIQEHVVHQALRRRMDSFAPRTLTSKQWMTTLQYFQGLCAYCQIRAYECLEHFIPTVLGGGTEAMNCVPSCLTCNCLKTNIHPELVISIPRQDIERVREYLTSFEKS